MEGFNNGSIRDVMVADVGTQANELTPIKADDLDVY